MTSNNAMKIIPALCALVLLAGCATGGSPQMSADKLSQIKPGQTTRSEMVQWFGEPIAIGMDTSGKSSATWYHTRIIAAPFYTDMKHQMLVGIFETNNMLLSFTLSDQIKATNAPPRSAPSPKGAAK